MAGLTGYLVIALMFTSGIWFLAVCAGKTLVVPLLKAEKFAGEIAKGSGRDMVLREEGTNEIRGITEKLNAIAARLANTYRFLQSMNKGDFNSELKVDDDSDILGNELLKTRTGTVKTAEEQSRTNEETMKRRYITEGLAKFAGFMRAGDNLKSMGDNFIRNLVRYLNAVQGGLFLLEEGDDRPYLNLLAAFAYDRKKFFEKRIEIGEGLSAPVLSKKIQLTLQKSLKDTFQ
jgi:hypothetical protein